VIEIGRHTRSFYYPRSSELVVVIDPRFRCSASYHTTLTARWVLTSISHFQDRRGVVSLSLLLHFSRYLAARCKPDVTGVSVNSLQPKPVEDW
jgi:hypothetical protein